MALTPLISSHRVLVNASGTDDNVFIYFQPGAGKVDIKNPTRQAEAALAKLGEIIDVLEGL
jgi:hypothetical protein